MPRVSLIRARALAKLAEAEASMPSSRSDRARDHETPPADARRGRAFASWISLACVAILAAVLLFWELGTRYLWQDEAACAVLAERMLETGVPRGYDGKNLITMDEFRREDATELERLAGDADGMVQHFVAHGDFKADTTWIGQPWGQFAIAAASLGLFGADTLQARLPFAIAGVLTVLLLFQLARTRFADRRIAWIAILLLAANTYWFLHTRQCRYYSTATLGLFATLFAYVRWQEGRRFGAAAFVACGWLWFHNDFGSPWPVFAIMGLDALLRGRVLRKTTLATFAALGLVLAPFVFFYQLHTRVKQTFLPWDQKLLATLYNTNQFQLPLLIAALALFLVWRDARASAKARAEAGGESGDETVGETVGERHLLGLCLAIVTAKLLWMPTVGPMHFYRYVVDLTPLSCLLVAWTFVRVAELTRAPRAAQTLLAAGLMGVQLVSSAFAEPLRALFPERARSFAPPGWIVRPELGVYAAELAGSVPDPNRETVEFLRARLKPEDEVLVNYEDCPLMFYLPNRIRGGIPAFRAFDTAKQPRFVVLRRNAAVTHWAIYTQVIVRGSDIDKERWETVPVRIEDIIWGNNPDPGCVPSELLLRQRRWSELLVLEARAPR